MEVGEIGGVANRLEAAAREQRQAAGNELRVMLLGNGELAGKSEKRLAELLTTLDLKPAQLPDVMEIVQRIRDYQALQERRPVWQKEQGQASREVAEIGEWEAGEHERVKKEAEARRQEPAAAMNRAGSRISIVAVADRWINSLCQAWDAIVSGDGAADAFGRLEVVRRDAPLFDVADILKQ